MSAQRKPPKSEADHTEPATAREPEVAEEATADEAGADETITELQAKVDENWDRYLRAAAEADNVRKRAQRDVEHARKFALEGFSRELLAVVDSLEIGLEAAESADAAALIEGSEATCKLLKTTLERFGVVEVDPEGEPFDPEFHEAISMMPSASVEPGSVLTVVQKGYTLNGRLLRPARVVVAAETPATDAGESAN
jgi:molecular chaperone GrpE